MGRVFRVERDCEVGRRGDRVEYLGEGYWEGEGGLRRAVVAGDVYPEYVVGESYSGAGAVGEMVGIFEGFTGGEAMNRLYWLVFNLGPDRENGERYRVAAGAIEACVRRSHG